jgi:hypothetical protein
MRRWQNGKEWTTVDYNGPMRTKMWRVTSNPNVTLILLNTFGTKLVMWVPVTTALRVLGLWMEKDRTYGG